jgi:type II secretory pathway pseudopilin PulG
MRAAVARLRERCAGPRSVDDGISMTEVLVAMTVFAVVSAALLSALTVGFGMSSANRSRVVAANVAASELDLARSEGFDAVATRLNQPVTVGGGRFTLNRYVNPERRDGKSTCAAGSSAQAFKKVTVVVDWPNRKYSQPVRSDTIVRPTGLPGDEGAVAVTVTDRAARPVVDMPVTVGAKTVTTDKEGCAHVAPFGAGTYTVTVGAPGYIDSNEQGLVRSTTVALNQVTPLALSIDKAAAVTLTHQVLDATDRAVTGFAVPTGLAMRLEIPTNTTAQRALTYTGSPLLAQNLYPESHQAFFGNCLRGDEYGAAQFTPTPGGSSTLSVPLAAVTITPKTGPKFPGGTVKAVRQGDDGKCTTGSETVDLGTLPATAAASLKVAMPYGQWRFTFTPTSGGATTTLTQTVLPKQIAAIQVVSP